MKKIVVAFLLLVCSSAAQIQIDAAAPPPVQSAGAVAQGTFGGTTLWYWVVARYPIGSAQPSSAAVAANTQGVGNLSVSNFVRVSWQAMPGATGYDVLRSADGVYPAPCAACAVVLNTSSTSVDDVGSSLSAYPGSVLAAPPVSAVATINNRDEAAPFINVRMLQNFRLPLILSWSLGNCVEYGAGGKLTDAGAPCGTGSGGSSLALNVQFTSASVLTIGSNCSVASPCIVGTGSASYQITASATVTWNSGVGTIYVYINPLTGGLIVGYGGTLSITCSAGCITASGVTAMPFTATPIYEWAATGSGWDATGVDARATLRRERVLVEGANITLIQTADTVTVSAAASGSGYDPMDLTSEVFDTWAIETGYYPLGWYMSEVPGSQCGGSVAPSGQDPVLGTYNAPGSLNGYCLAYHAARSQASGSRFTDLVSASNFRAFDYVARVGMSSTSDIILRFGVFASDTANPQGLYVEYNSSVGPNWRCVVNDGSATATDSGVAAATAVVSMHLSATAAGTLSCKVGATTVTATDTFPAAAFWGIQVQTLTASGKSFVLGSPRLKFSGLTR